MFVITPVILLVLALAGGGAAALAKDGEQQEATEDKVELAVESEAVSPAAEQQDAKTVEFDSLN